MKYIIERRKAVEIYYYFMAIDGRIHDCELKLFNDIAMNTDPEHIEEYRSEFISKCNDEIAGVKTKNDYPDFVKRHIDCIIREENNKLADGIPRRLLIWDLYAIAASDGEISSDEKSLIEYIGNKLEIEQSVILEMYQIIATEGELSTVIDELSLSREPYVEVRPVIEEYEQRMSTLFEAARNLIDDDIFEIEIEDKDIIAGVGKFVSDTASKGLDELKTGTDKLLGLLKKD